MYHQAFKNIDGVFRKEAARPAELDCTERTSWTLFFNLDNLTHEAAIRRPTTNGNIGYLQKASSSTSRRAMGQREN